MLCGTPNSLFWQSIRQAPAEYLADALFGNMQMPLALKVRVVTRCIWGSSVPGIYLKHCGSCNAQVNILEELNVTKRLSKIHGLIQYQVENFEVLKGVNNSVEVRDHMISLLSVLTDKCLKRS